MSLISPASFRSSSLGINFSKNTKTWPSMHWKLQYCTWCSWVALRFHAKLVYHINIRQWYTMIMFDMTSIIVGTDFCPNPSLVSQEARLPKLAPRSDDVDFQYLGTGWTAGKRNRGPCHCGDLTAINFGMWKITRQTFPAAEMGNASESGVPNTSAKNRPALFSQCQLHRLYYYRLQTLLLLKTTG